MSEGDYRGGQGKPRGLPVTKVSTKSCAPFARGDPRGQNNVRLLERYPITRGSRGGQAQAQGGSRTALIFA